MSAPVGWDTDIAEMSQILDDASVITVGEFGSTVSAETDRRGRRIDMTRRIEWFGENGIDGDALYHRGRRAGDQ